MRPDHCEQATRCAEAAAGTTDQAKPPIGFFETPNEAVLAWAAKTIAQTRGDHLERGGMLVSRARAGKRYYAVVRTGTGNNRTCWNAFVLGYLFHAGRLEGFAHTHPANKRTDGSWNARDYGPSNTDLRLFRLAGIRRQYIANEAGEVYAFDRRSKRSFLTKA